MRFQLSKMMIVIILLFPAVKSGALGTEKPWWIGIYAGTCGFSENTGLPEAEYLSAGIFVEPLSVHVFNPALKCGVIFPVAPCRKEGVLFQFGGELTLVDIPSSVLRDRFYAAMCISPAVGADYLVSTDFQSVSFDVSIAPLRFRAGDGVLTLCSLHVFIIESPGFEGWGLVLFEAALFLF